jgi:hypothetical protein
VRNAELYQQVSEEQQALSAMIENSAEGVMILDARAASRSLTGP